MTLREDSYPKNVKVTELEEEIVRFDSILDRIQKVMPEDLEVHDRIVEVRGAVFRLMQTMRGCKIIEFAAPWLDLTEEEVMKEDHEF